jgi:isopentenyl-diphosphate delta-isomerase
VYDAVMAEDAAVAEDNVVLVDAHDAPTGEAPKLEAHRQGLLHRAFSVFLYDSAGRMLLQQRAHAKYHSGGLWTNTCCSHPRPGEATPAAAARRLREEMGVDCRFAPAFEFVYHASFDNGLVEHEYDHVFVGRFDGEPRPDPAEVADWRWAGIEELRAELEAEPERFSAWFRIAFEKLHVR